jgi:hypothetical protein
MLVRHDPAEVKALQSLKIRRADKERVVLQTLCDPGRPRVLCALGHLIVRIGRLLEGQKPEPIDMDVNRRFGPVH